MSSLSFVPKNKIQPLNLTSETVHQILKQAPSHVPSLKKIYPTVKYGTEEIRCMTDNKVNIHRKIKDLDRNQNENKRSRSKPQYAQKQVPHHNIKFLNYDSSNFRLNELEEKKIKQERNLLFAQRQNNKKLQKQLYEQKKSTQKYFERINKIKNLKLKQYMKNQFAIQIKTIETTREDTFINDTQSNPVEGRRNNWKYQKNHYKSKVIIKYHKKQRNPYNNNQDEQRNMSQTNNATEPDKSPSSHIKLQRIMQRSQNLSKVMLQTQTKDKIREKTFTITKNFIQENPVDRRFQRWRSHLNLILFSFCIISDGKPLSPYTRNCFKYKYYVGSGNNKNLIVSVLKKRWWWTQASTISEAQFVWTQIKQSKILQNCSRYQSSRQIFEQKKLLQKTPSNSKYSKRQKQKDELYSKNNKLFHQNSNIKYNEDSYQIESKKNLKIIEIPKKIHNHYQGNSSIGNKKALFYYISAYCEHKNLNRYDYIPLTFHIVDQKSPQIINFQKAYTENPGSYWIIKPGENTNRGNGISVTKSINQIRQKIKNLSQKTLIIQKYIDNLFLYNSRKFDVRTYMIAITIAGSTKFYWYQQGYIRTSSYIFNLKKCDDIYIHLTNDAIQCQSSNYSKYEQGNKLSYQQFQRYLDLNYYSKSYSIKSAHDQMKNIAKLAVQAAYPQINRNKLSYAFQLFGLDFILDGQFRPWLIQINTNPCLELCSPCLQRLIPQVIQNTIRLALDPVYQPSVQFPRSLSSSIPDNIIQTNRFELIYDDIFDRDAKWQNKILSQNMKIGQQQQQQAQVYEGDGQILENI